MVVDLYQQGRNLKDIAEILNIPGTTISYVIKKFREWGSTENSQRPDRPGLIQDWDYRQLERLVKNDRRALLGKMSPLTTKPTKCPVRPAKTQISLGICPV